MQLAALQRKVAPLAFTESWASMNGKDGATCGPLATTCSSSSYLYTCLPLAASCTSGIYRLHNPDTKLRLNHLETPRLNLRARMLFDLRYSKLCSLPDTRCCGCCTGMARERHILLANHGIRKVILQHESDILYIEAARSEICGHKA